MSAQAGVFYTDRRPIPREVVERIDAALADFGPDGGGSRLEPGLLMLSRALHITPEDEREEQPLVSPAGRLLTWDGRLDNRDDLLLQFHRDLGIDATDGALALAAFERWGVDGFARLIGDWSLALWDAPERRLVLASDYMGVRPLYYRRAADHIAWSSSLGELVLREGVKDDLDEVFVVGFLVGFVPADRTPYLPVRAVTPAHALSFSAAGAMCHRFYEYPTNTIRYRHGWEYEEHLREVFAKTVGARLRSTRPVWADLSGGLDSSSVVCMADWLIRTSVVQARPPRTVSIVSSGSPEVDERPFIIAVEDYRGTPGDHIDVDALTGVFEPGERWVTPRYSRDAAVARLRHVANSGARVLLTGNDGDLVMANHPDWSHAALEQLRVGALWTFFQETHAWSHATKKPLAEIVARCLSQLAPARWRAMLRNRREVAVVRSRVTAGQGAVGEWLTARRRAFSENLSAMWDEAIASEQQGTAVLHPILAVLLRSAGQRIRQTPTDVPDVITTHPFLDRRLVETVCSLPQGVLNRPGETRSLMRRAFRGFLPHAVNTRFSKGYVSPHWMRSVLGPVVRDRSNAQEWKLVEEGWVTLPGMESALEMVRTGRPGADRLVLPMIHVEEWLRARTIHSFDDPVPQACERTLSPFHNERR